MTLSAAGASKAIAQLIPMLAAGRLDAAAIRALCDVERGKHRLLLEAVRRSFPSSPRATELAQAFSLLIDVEREAPEIVADLLALPQVGGWAAGCLNPENPSTGGAACEQPGYLCCLAAAAASSASIPFDLNVPVRDGVVDLPGLGHLMVRGSKTGEWVRLRFGPPETLVATYRGREMRIQPWPRERSRDWVPIPRLSAQTGALTIDLLLDTDEHLAAGFGQMTPEPVGSKDRWSALLAEAWRILTERHQASAEAVALAVRTLVPLAASAGPGAPSASSGWLWGAIALGLPPDPLTFAEILVHEVHHLLLAAIEDEVPLVLPEATDGMYAPWRDDPRPASGLLHGTFANVALAEFWLTETRAKSAADPPASLRAEVEFAWRCMATRDAARDLIRSGTLTEAGRIFVTALQSRLEARRHDPVSVRASRLAEEMTMEHRLRWRLAHLRPDHRTVGRLARAWTAGKEPPPPSSWPQPVVHPGPILDGRRQTLLVLRGRAPETFAAGLADHDPPPTERALLLGDDDTARRGYLAQIAAGKAPDAWIGLALLELRADDTAGHSPLLTCPETVMAVHERLRTLTGKPTEPAALIEWMASRN